VRRALTLGILLLSAPACLANIIVSYGAAGAQTTTVSGASTYNFDSLTAGLNTNVVWSGVGTFDSVWAQAADQFGGAGGTGKYAVTGSEASSANLLSTTLTLSTPQAYIGFWLSAADAQNNLSLYQGTTLLATVNLSVVVNALGTCSTSNHYCGNPNNTTQDTGEPFVYVNFFGTSGTTITKAVFTNANNSTGFEFDNVSVDPTQVAVTGTVVSSIIVTPEPANLALAASGLGLLALLLRRRRPII